MPPTPKFALVIAASVALGGCIDCPLETAIFGEKGRDAAPARTRAAAVDPPAEEVVVAEEKKTADDDLRLWCGQRFIDHQDGKKPGGARTVEQKQADDRMCEALRKD